VTNSTDALREPLRKVLGPRVAKLLEASLELVTVDDLLRHYPRRYLELGELTEISSLPMDEPVSLIAEVKTVSVREMKTKRAKIMNVVVTDGKGQLNLTFFNNVYKQQKDLPVGRRALFTGKVSQYNGAKQLAQPMYELFGDEEADRDQVEQTVLRPYPIYPATSKVSSVQLRSAVQLVLDTLGEVQDPLPSKVRLHRGLIDLRSALQQIHRPDDMAQTFPAKRRLKFEEAFILQTALSWRRAAKRDQTATPRPQVPGGLLDRLDAKLPFTLTAGQVTVGEQIAADLERGFPMHRLLQGEVGSGKTLVALRAMLTVVDSGGQAALLAPTEVLAAQHHRSISAMLGDLAQAGMLGGDERGTRVTLLTGSLPAAARRKAMLEAASGDAGIVIGTHALLQDKVQFQDLGLVVVDEQHRFGVEQRDALRGKGVTVPHLLVMTATPIPRTVAMTVFGDLESSVLDQLPAGRQEIATHVVHLKDERWMARVWKRVAEEAAAGHQTFVVCPRIGDKEKDKLKLVDLDNADPADFDDADLAELEELFAEEDGPARRPAAAVDEVVVELRNNPTLQGLVIETLHGRMLPDERDDVMRRFTLGEVHVLVATTVIEVGVDVPNSTVMVVMDADRFGVSQLHQLRGRIGRGSAAGLCLLVTEAGEGLASDRLEAVANTRDGFELARLDLEQRREGDVLGTAQSGLKSSLKLLRVLRDEKVIAEARDEANAVVAEDPRLRSHPALVTVLKSWVGSEQAAYLERS
jgi:ATP-dependent DNA helicase RecG